MDFPTLITGLKQRLQQSLPGAVAHEPMRATPVGSVRPVFNHLLPAKPGAVLILLYPDNGMIKIPLTKRNDYLGAHGGQISFPGGKREQGENAVENALRECEEEIGVKQTLPEVIGKLTDFFVIPSNFMVTPVVAVCDERPVFVPDSREVFRILECNLEALIAKDAVKEKEILAAGQYPMFAPHFEVEGEIVWGATAMMLNELRLVVQDTLMK